VQIINYKQFRYRLSDLDTCIDFFFSSKPCDVKNFEFFVEQLKLALEALEILKKEKNEENGITTK